MIHPVIMAGGTGSRLWPLSRQLNPKQFLKLTDSRLSMLQLTVARLDGMEAADPLLICNEDHRFLAAEQMRVSGYRDARIILEPCGRNTAPAIALARSEEHTSELQSRPHLVCRLLLEKKKNYISII